jgi:hypothetical protein
MQMSALRWAVVPLAVGALSANVALAAADEPPDPTPSSESTPAPHEPDSGVMPFVTTVTTTTTNVNAPITVVAAPITTTVNGTNPAIRTPGLPVRNEAVPARFVMNLRGCDASARGAPGARHDRVRRANVRLAPDASLVVQVNGRRVTTLRLPSAETSAQGVALRLRLAPNGRLTIRRPSGRIMAIEGCTPA